MWLVIPSTCFPSAPAQVFLTSPLDDPWLALERSATWRGKLTRQQFWRRAWRKARSGRGKNAWMKRLSGLTLPPSMAARGVDSWIASLRDCHASRTASPASSADTPTSAPSGPSHSGSLRKCSPPWSSSKTSPDSSSSSSQSASDFHRWIFDLRRDCLARRKSARARNASDSLSWPTAKATNGGGESSERKKELGRADSGGSDLIGAVEMWPSPDTPTSGTRMRRQSGGEKHQQTVGDRVAQWKTPHGMMGQEADGSYGCGGEFAQQATRWQTPATDSFRGRGAERKDEMGLDQQARFWPTPDACPERGKNRRYLKNDSKAGRMLKMEVENWGTPRIAQNSFVGQCEPNKSRLEDQITLWATPNASDPHLGFQDRSTGKRGSQIGLSTQICRVSLPAPVIHGGPPSSSDIPSFVLFWLFQLPTTRRRLNPCFVEWLMGWPIGWTACGSAETESSTRPPSWLSSRCEGSF